MSIALHIIGLVLLGDLIFIFCLYVLYWYETLNNPCPALHPPKFTLKNVLHCAGRFFMLHAARPFSFLLWFGSRIRRRAAGKDAPSGLPPVVLVHGIYDTPSSWCLLGHRLRKDGYEAYRYHYSSFRNTPDTVVSGLDAFLREVAAKTGGLKPILIGHSMGGLIIRRWLALPGNETQIAGVVTISTPHRGSKLGVFAIGSLARNLKPDSVFLREIAALPAPSIPCLSLASAVDELVLPAESLLPPAGWRFQETDHASHLGMLFRRSVYDALLRELETCP